MYITEKCKNHTEMMQTPIPVISIQPYATVKEPLEDIVEPTEQVPLCDKDSSLICERRLLNIVGR